MSFTLVIIPLSLGLRQLLFQQNLEREFEVIQSLTQLLYTEYAENYLDSFEEEDAHFLALEVALNTSNYKGVIVIGVYDKELQLREQFPLKIKKQEIALPQQVIIGKTENIEYIENDTIPLPLLKLFVPIAAGKTNEAHHHILYWINAKDFKQKIGKIDQLILYYSIAAWLAACLFLIASSIVFEIISRSIHKRLKQKEQDLIDINNEVKQHLKTSALGAVSASLLHDIKNPLNSIDAFIKNYKNNSQDIDTEDWNLAQDASKRMRKMIADVSDILRDNPQSETMHYELKDIHAILSEEFIETITISGFESQPNLRIPSRHASQLLIILKQLIRNSIESASTEKPIQITAQVNQEDGLKIYVQDYSGGLPKGIQEQLFTPVHSTKVRGSGLGLYIAAQLAKTIDAKLQLEKSDSTGSLFSIHLPYIKETT